MTEYSLIEVAQAQVSARAMTTALVVASRLDPDTRFPHVAMIARQYGGNDLTAHAIELRLDLLAMLVDIDPSLTAVTAKLSPDQIGAVLAACPIRVREQSFDFDGEDLATALRLCADPEAHA